MLRRLLGLSGNKGPSGPSHSRAYAIGDVHGRLDLLQHLLRQIARDNEARRPAKTYIVFLGDLIDRGPDSRGVIEFLLSRPADFARPVYIKGNHEEFFLRVLDGEEDMVVDWLTYGGYQCCESYGVTQGWTLNASAREIQERLRAVDPYLSAARFQKAHDQVEQRAFAASCLAQQPDPLAFPDRQGNVPKRLLATAGIAETQFLEVDRRGEIEFPGGFSPLIA